MSRPSPFCITYDSNCEIKSITSVLGHTIYGKTNMVFIFENNQITELHYILSNSNPTKIPHIVYKYTNNKVSDVYHFDKGNTSVQSYMNKDLGKNLLIKTSEEFLDKLGQYKAFDIKII